jgi:hypothetical protein
MSTDKTAEEFVTVIRALLLEGDFYAAQKLSFEAIRYAYRPVTEKENTSRIILPVFMEDVPTEAVVDTGA